MEYRIELFFLELFRWRNRFCLTGQSNESLNIVIGIATFPPSSSVS